MSGTLLAFDFGTKSIGVAVGQRITGTARPLPAIKAQDGTPDWNIIEHLLKEWQPDEIIVGLPHHGRHPVHPQVSGLKLPLIISCIFFILFSSCAKRLENFSGPLLLLDIHQLLE